MSKSAKTKSTTRPKNRRFLGRVKSLGLLASILIIIGIGFPQAVRHAIGFFTVKRIMIAGNRYISSKEVLDATGLPNARNIFAADLNKATQAIKEFPNIKNVEIRRILPDIIGINVVEYRPIAILRGEYPMLIDNEGTILKLDLYSAKVDLPVLTGIYSEENISAERIKKAQTILQIIEKRDFPVKISEIDLSDADNIVLYPNNLPVGILLGGEKLDERLEKLIVAWDQIEAQIKPFDCLDLRFRRQIVLKPAVSTELITAKK